MLAAHGGDLERAVTLLEEALELHDRLPVPLERGRTLLALGMTHRRARHRRAARERLLEAATLFDDVGAAIWRDRARRELGRISGRVAGSRDELTPTERQPPSSSRRAGATARSPPSCSSPCARSRRT